MLTMLRDLLGADLSANRLAEDLGAWGSIDLAPAVVRDRSAAARREPCRAGRAQELLARVEPITSSRRVVLDMDSTEVRGHGRQEQSAYNGHFESTCYRPLLSNREGDRLAAKLRPGNVHSADGWEDALLPEIDRQQAQGKEVAFRGDAAFAKPELY
jgi:hypothetical protein